MLSLFERKVEVIITNQQINFQEDQLNEQQFQISERVILVQTKHVFFILALSSFFHRILENPDASKKIALKKAFKTNSEILSVRFDSDDSQLAAGITLQSLFTYN